MADKIAARLPSFLLSVMKPQGFPARLDPGQHRSRTKRRRLGESNSATLASVTSPFRDKQREKSPAKSNSCAFKSWVYPAELAAAGAMIA
jgi:hypothetical protein